MNGHVVKNSWLLTEGGKREGRRATSKKVTEHKKEKETQKVLRPCSEFLLQVVHHETLTKIFL